VFKENKKLFEFRLFKHKFYF